METLLRCDTVLVLTNFLSFSFIQNLHNPEKKSSTDSCQNQQKIPTVSTKRPLQTRSPYTAKFPRLQVNHTQILFFIFFLKFLLGQVHFVEPLIAPVLDLVCPSSWVSNPVWIYHVDSFLLVCGDPESPTCYDTCLFH